MTPSTAPAPSGLLRGTIARMRPDRGFFFVLCEQDGHDYFCHASDLVGCRMDELQHGMSLRFEGSQTEKGYRASKVRRDDGNSI